MPLKNPNPPNSSVDSAWICGESPLFDDSQSSSPHFDDSQSKSPSPPLFDDSETQSPSPPLCDDSAAQPPSPPLFSDESMVHQSPDPALNDEFPVPESMVAKIEAMMVAKIEGMPPMRWVKQGPENSALWEDDADVNLTYEKWKQKYIAKGLLIERKSSRK